MTIKEALIAEIEPYSLSEDAITKTLIDAQSRIDGGSEEDDYTSDSRRMVALAAMMCLNRLRVLASENIGGISQSYNTSELVKRIKAIASGAGLSADLVLGETNDFNVTSVSVW